MNFREAKDSYTEEIKRLQQRYDELKDNRDRAAERYKADYKKWRAFNDWMFTENEAHRKHRNEPGISKEEKAHRDMDSLMRKRQKMVEIGPGVAKFKNTTENGGMHICFLHGMWVDDEQVLLPSAGSTQAKKRRTVTKLLEVDPLLNWMA